MPFPVDDARISAAEKKLGRRLPEGFRHRLKDQNGGEFEAGGAVWFLHPIFDDSDRRRLRRTATNNVVHETEQARGAFEDLMPEHATVVANDGGGNYLLLLAGEDVPCRWEPRTGDLEAAPTDWSQSSADATADE